MLTWFRRTVRKIGRTDPRIWWGILLIGGVILVVVGFSLGGNPAVNPEVVQATINAAVTQYNVYVPTIEAYLTETPANAALTEAAPTLSLAGQQSVRQFAASAMADSQLGELDWSAVQAAGPPNTSECGNFRTAWATALPNGQGILRLYYAQLVTPTGILIHETFNPGFIVRVSLTDIYNEEHVVYEAVPQPRAECPFILVIAIPDADYQSSVVTIYLDQSTSTGGWDQIDAVELIGIKY